jgi:hypothetical protein
MISSAYKDGLEFDKQVEDAERDKAASVTNASLPTPSTGQHALVDAFKSMLAAGLSRLQRRRVEHRERCRSSSIFIAWII